MNTIKINHHKQPQSFQQIALCFAVCTCCFGIIIGACMALHPALHLVHGYFNSCIESINIKIRGCYP